MESQTGTYVLVLKNGVERTIQIGRRGNVLLAAGYYLYVGSAFGPGGVRARVSRHYRCKKKHHWHIDYITEVMDIDVTWYNHGPERLEHDWARALAEMHNTAVVKAIGNSDCHCESHFFYCADRPDCAFFYAAMGDEIELWQPQAS